MSKEAISGNLSYDFISSVWPDVRTSPVFDSSFGKGYSIHLQGEKPLKITIFPDGKVIGMQTKNIKLEIGGIKTVEAVDGILCFKMSAEPEITKLQIAHDGSFLITRETDVLRESPRRLLK